MIGAMGFCIRRILPCLAVFFAASALVAADAPSTRPTLERIANSRDRHTLIRQPSGKLFVPWGFNYDRDYRMRLIEDYWVDEWDTVAADFREMKALGANIVRIHLSVSQFLDAPDKPNAKNVAQLRKLVKYCEEIGIYLDVTGLGMYRKEQVPAWYTSAGEADRWKMQATFWSVIAEACGGSTAVAWFDLVNEPVVPDRPQKPGEWSVGHLAKFWYGQFIVLDPAGRDRGEIARAWVRRMSDAIKRYDNAALITVGMLPFSAAEGEPSLGFDAMGLMNTVDLDCVHVYPGKPPTFDFAMLALGRFDRDRPVVIEEFFPMGCEPTDLPAFVEMTKTHADGWLGFYWGQTVEELERSTDPTDVKTREWLTLFPKMKPAGAE
jgi:hypothetical protein